MKKHYLSKYILGVFFLAGSLIGFTSCEDDSNDWSVDNSKAQMFTPVVFEVSRIEATAVDLSFTTVPNAKSYIVEYSKDSLEFGSIAGTLELLAEELIPDSGSATKRFLAPLKDLEPASRYSARIKATSNNGLPDSKWGEVTFKTVSEQIISEFTYGEDFAILKWKPGLQVDRYAVLIDNKGPGYSLTPENISKGEVEITGLQPNTEYTIVIFNGEKIRGRAAFKTYPKVSGDGKRYNLNADDNIVEVLNNIPESQVVLVLPAGARYEIGDVWTLPAHITSLTLWGLPADEEEKAYLNVKEIKLEPSVTDFKIWIQNMIVEGTDASADYLMNDNPSDPRTISEFRIENSNISAVRGVFRMRNQLTVENVTIDNCIINNIGSYGVVIVDATTVSLSTVILSNSTVYNINNADVMKFKSKVSFIDIKSCTFYNAQGKDRYFLNYDNKAANYPDRVGINKCIFAAPDASVTVRGTNPKRDNQFVFNSYKTNDYTVADNYPMSGISDYSKSSTDLFENAAEGNFKIMDMSIGGDVQPGDPRWW